MPAPRKPKKVFIQFAVALLVAAVFGVGAIIFGFSIITNVRQNADLAKQEAEKAKADAQAELDRIRNQQRQVVKTTYKTVQATQNIVPGQPITQEMVTLVETDDRPELGTLTSLPQAIGKLVRVPVMAGETLGQTKIMDNAGFLNVQTGMRAITIQVDNIGGLNGALYPGESVDILTTVTNEGKSITRTLLQNVQVLSVGNMDMSGSSSNKTGRSSSGGGPVTLAVSPKQAEILTLANELGSFHLTLRGFKDKQSIPMSGADVTTLVTGTERSALKKLPSLPSEPSSKTSGFHNVNYSPEANLPAPSNAKAGGSKFTMQIYRGTGAETVEFQQ